jgi:hypothetical protein
VLRITSAEQIATPPKELHELAKRFVAGINGTSTDLHGLKYPTLIPRSLPRGVEIRDVVLRTTREYRLEAATGYVLNISIHRQWSGADTRIEPKAATGFSLYNKDWDIDMAPRTSSSPRTWDSDLRSFVAPGSGSAFIGSFDRVDQIRRSLAEI